LSGHWQAKCWRLHPELHPGNHIDKRKVWRVKHKGKEGAAIVQGLTIVENFIYTNEVDNKLRPISKATPI
jgi:hypothetical protein